MATHFQSVQRAYRKMNHELSEKLSEKECKKIIYFDDLPTPDKDSNFCLDVLSLLEARGHTSPLKVDHLKMLLSEIHRLDLIPVVTQYEESKLYKDAVKEKKKRNKGKKKITDDDESQLLLEASMGSDKEKMMKFLYTLISNTTELTHILDVVREIMEKEERVERAMEQLQSVAKDGEEFAENLLKVFRSMDISSEGSSSSSEGSIADTPTIITDQQNPSLGDSASPSDIASTRQRSLAAGDSKYGCRKPKPLPRTKIPEHVRRPIQEESISASSSTPILPQEETAHEPTEPGVEAEEDQDDSGIGHAGDWLPGRRANSEGNLLESAPQNPVSDPDANYAPLLNYGHSADNLLESAPSQHGGPMYMPLLPRRNDAVYTSPSYKTQAQDH